MSLTPRATHPEHDASFGGARDGIAVLSPEWHIRYMNASMLEILRLIGRGAGIATLWDALPDWERSPEADSLRGAMETRAAVCFRVDGERGRGRVWEVQADPLESGELRVRLRNVTSQARQEQAEQAQRGADAGEAERALLARTREAEAAAAEAARRAEESRVLREISRALVSELEADRVLELAGRSAMDLLKSRAAAIALPVQGERVRLHTALGTLAGLAGREMPLSGSVVEVVLGDGATRVYNDVGGLPRRSLLHRVAGERGVRNVAVVPLRAFGAPVGVLAVMDRDGGFGADDVRLLEALSDSAALAIHNARVYAGERERAEENRALLAAAEALASTLDTGEVMGRIAAVARELTGADGAGITMFEGERGERTQVRAAAGILAPLAGQGGPAAGTITRMIADEGVPRAVALASLSELGGRELLRSLGAAYAALVPVRVEGETVGVLAAVNGAARGPFQPRELRMVGLLADQAALSVRNARLYERAEGASRAKSEFLAMMSHELRTPLNALEGYASLLEDGIFGPVNERQLDALRRMGVSRRHLMELIESVLDLVRVDARARFAQPSLVQLGELVESVGEAMRGAAEAKRLALRIDTEMAGSVTTDPGLLRQVLTNLLGNALKFTASGEIAITARTGGGEAVVEVRDTGPGIAAEHQQQIFEPFFQVDPSTTRREGGTGLGLALSRDFVRLLGGTLELESAPGRGSTFRVRVPLQAPASPG